MEALGGSRAPVPAVGVGTNPLAHLATQEFVHGHAQALADNVPTGDLDTGNSVLVELPAVGVDVPVHALDDPLDLERVHALICGFELVDSGFHGSGKGINGAL